MVLHTYWTQFNTPVLVPEWDTWKSPDTEIAAGKQNISDRNLIDTPNPLTKRIITIELNMVLLEAGSDSGLFVLECLPFVCKVDTQFAGCNLIPQQRKVIAKPLQPHSESVQPWKASPTQIKIPQHCMEVKK